MRTDELDLVRRFVQDGPELPREVMDRARQRLTEAMATSAEVVPLITSPDTDLDRRRRRFVLPAVVAAAVLAVSGIAVGVTVSGGGSARPSTGVRVHRESLAVAELDRAARLVADDATPVPGPGEYQYTETDSATLVALNSAGNLTPPDVTPSTMVSQSASSAPNPNAPDAGATYRVWDETHAQSWVGANDNGQASFTFSTSFFSPQDKSVWQAAGSPQVDVAGAPSTASLSASGFPDVTGLPTDPQALFRTLESGAYGPANNASAAFSAVGELLQDPKDNSPALRSALYQAAALIPGTEALGTIANQAGQQGQGIGLTQDGVRSELIVDPSSGQLLGTEDVALDPSDASEALIQSARVVPAGVVVSWWSVIDSGIVASLSSTPAPSKGSNS